MKQEILGLQFDNVTMEEALTVGEGFLDGDHAAIVVTPNAEIGYDAAKDPAFCALLNRADLMLPFARRGTMLCLLGSKPGVAEQAAEKMRSMAPGLVICGTADGYFKEEAPVIEKINAAGAEALFVCLGAPKQERFMFAHRDELKTVRLMAGLGGSLDGFAGNVKRAPKWMIKLNLEWFYRLCKEPKRLGRMMRLPKYLIKAVGSRQTGTDNRQ